MQEGLQERFNVADLDKDGRLSKEEFEMFVHPDRHKEMMQHLVGEQLTRFDTDKDGKISFEEYMSKLSQLSLLIVARLYDTHTLSSSPPKNTTIQPASRWMRCLNGLSTNRENLRQSSTSTETVSWTVVRSKVGSPQVMRNLLTRKSNISSMISTKTRSTP